MIYVAVSVTNQCDYCIASHTVSARKKGMTDDMFKELMAVVGMANETNRLVAGYQVEIDEQFRNWSLVVGRSSLGKSAGDLLLLFLLGFCEFEFVIFHVYAFSAKPYSFGFQAQALFDGGVSAQFYFASGAQYSVPGQIKRAVERAHYLSGCSGISGGAGDGAVGRNLASGNFTDRGNDPGVHGVSHDGCRGHCGRGRPHHTNTHDYAAAPFL